MLAKKNISEDTSWAISNEIIVFINFLAENYYLKETELLRCLTMNGGLSWNGRLVNLISLLNPIENSASFISNEGNIPSENCQNSTRETSAENVENTPPFSEIFYILTPISIQTIIKKMEPKSFSRVRCANNAIRIFIEKHRKNLNIKMPVLHLEITRNSMMAVTNMACRENLYVVEGESMAEFTAIQPREIFIALSIFGARIRNLVKVEEAEEKSKVSDKWRDDILYVQRQFGLIMDKEGKISKNSKLSMQVKLLHCGAMECPEELLSTLFQEWREGGRVIEEIVISFQKPVDHLKRLVEAILGPGNFSRLWSVEKHETSIYTTQLEQLKEQIASSDLDSIEIFIALSRDKKRSLIMTIASNAITIDTTGSDLADIERLARRTFARFAKINSIYMVNTNRLRKLVASMR